MYDAIVVGAGYGGVTCAALLAKQGRRVLLVDKNPQPGGKAVTLQRSGFGYEMWPIAGGPSEFSRFHELAAALDLDVEADLLLPEEAGEFRYLRPGQPPTVMPFSARPSTDPMASVRMPALLGATDEETQNMLGFVTQCFSAPDAEIAVLDDIDAATWIRGFGIGRPLESYLFTILNLLFVVPVDRLAASEALRTLRDFFRGGGGRYHRGGFGRPAEAAVAFLEKHGGTYMPNTRVDRVLVEDGRAVGIVTAEGEARAPVVVSNAGIQPTVLSLCEAGSLPDEYVRRVRSLEPSWAFVGLRYWLDAPVLTQPMLLQWSDESWLDSERYARAESGDWPAEPLLFFTVPSLYDASLAPEGQQLVLAGTIASPDPNSPMGDRAVEIVDAAMQRNFPEIAGHILRTQAYTARHASNASRDAVVPGQGGECIGLAQVVGQCGASKPDVRTPLPGLYLVGCDAGGYGCGTHQAVDSGFNVADVVAADLASMTHA